MECRITNGIRHEPGLWVYKLQLVAAALDPIGARFGADANPVDAWWDAHRAVGLDRDLETLRMQRLDQGAVDLQERLSACQNHVLVAFAHRPERGDLQGEVAGPCKLPSKRAIGADKVGVAELASCLGAVFLTPRPKVAPRKAAEHGRPARAQTLSLQRVEDLLD